MLLGKKIRVLIESFISNLCDIIENLNARHSATDDLSPFCEKRIRYSMLEFFRGIAARHLKKI